MAKSSRSFRPYLFAVVCLLFFSPAGLLKGQTLARPGWLGSGLSAQTWWKHAIFYQIDVRSFASSSDTEVGQGSPTALKEIAQHLDYLRSLGVDAILLTPLNASSQASGAASSQAGPIDPTLGTLDDFDGLSLQASLRGIRILLELPHPVPALARFWLTRGVAGFYIPGSSSAGSADAVQAIRKLLPGFVGKRVLITDAELASSFTSKSSGNELVFDRDILKLPAVASSNIAAQLRAALEQSQVLLRSATPAIAADAPAVPRSLDRFGALVAAHGNTPDREAQNLAMAKVIATVLLLNRSAALLFYGQELGVSSPSGATVAMPWGPTPASTAPEEEGARPAAPPVTRPGPNVYLPYNPHKAATAAAKPVPPDPASAAGQDANPRSLLNFYRRLSQLHHGNTALNDGEEIVLDHDDQNALVWVRKPPAVSPQRPAMVVACNFSDKPVVLSLGGDMARLHLRGSFLRTVLRSDEALGSMHLNAMTLPPFGVYVGELRY